MLDQTIKPEPKKAHCPTCDGERSCEVHGHISCPWDWEDREHGYSMNGGTEHWLLRCKGCETVFYETSKWHSEDIDQWYDSEGHTQGEYRRTRTTHPKPEGKTKPNWFEAIGGVDLQLHAILTETYLAYDNEAYILTAVGLRTALDRATEVLGIDPAKTFEEKLEELATSGWIGATERDTLEMITNAGNAAAHRGWSPNSEMLDHLIATMELFVHRSVLIGRNAPSIKSSIPPRPKRQKVASPKAKAP